jgi:hypothetical protein
LLIYLKYKLQYGEELSLLKQRDQNPEWGLFIKNLGWTSKLPERMKEKKGDEWHVRKDIWHLNNYMFSCKIFHNNCYSIVKNIGCGMLFKEPQKTISIFDIAKKTFVEKLCILDFYI